MYIYIYVYVYIYIYIYIYNTHNNTGNNKDPGGVGRADLVHVDQLLLAVLALHVAELELRVHEDLGDGHFFQGN